MHLQPKNRAYRSQPPAKRVNCGGSCSSSAWSPRWLTHASGRTLREHFWYETNSRLLFALISCVLKHMAGTWIHWAAANMRQLKKSRASTLTTCNVPRSNALKLVYNFSLNWSSFKELCSSVFFPHWIFKIVYRVLISNLAWPFIPWH